MILLALPSATVTVSVDGEGSLRFARNGALVYARRATLRAQGGAVVNEAGLPLAPRVAVAGPFSVALDGTITAAGRVAGRIVLARLANGRVTLTNPGDGLAGVIRVTVIRTGGPAVARAAPTPKIAGPKTAAISIAVRARTQLDGERILLGGIADIEAPAVWKTRLAAIDLGLLPPLGTTRLVGASYVRALVRGLGLGPTAFALTVPPGATAARSGIVVEAQEILDQALAGNEGYVPSRAVAAMTVPVGKLALSAAPTSRGTTGRNVVVTATVDGKPAGSRTIALVPDPSVPVARIGESVRLRLLSGGATIELPAKVKVGGRQGADVTVVTATGSVHTGRLLPNGLVEVRL